MTSAIGDKVAITNTTKIPSQTPQAETRAVIPGNIGVMSGRIVEAPAPIIQDQEEMFRALAKLIQIRDEGRIFSFENEFPEAEFFGDVSMTSCEEYEEEGQYPV